MSAARFEDEYRRRLNRRIRHDRLWAPPEETQLDLFPDDGDGGLRHISGVLDDWLCAQGGTVVP